MEQIQLSQLQENMRAIIVAMRLSDKSVLISDKGKPIAKIVPVSSSEQSWLGCMKDTGKIVGDVVSPAESELAAIERDWQEAETTKQGAAEEAKRQQPAQWQQIGIELVRIPACEFLYGWDERVHLPEYWIAKTPVTNAQYAAFVQVTGYPAPKHWEDDRIPAGKENHPVVMVNWDDAQAFCRWAGLHLPSEQQWEKAARGMDGRFIPLGQPGAHYGAVQLREKRHRYGTGGSVSVWRQPVWPAGHGGQRGGMVRGLV